MFLISLIPSSIFLSEQFEYTKTMVIPIPMITSMDKIEIFWEDHGHLSAHDCTITKPLRH